MSTTICEPKQGCMNCSFDCNQFGYCRYDAIFDEKQHDQYINDVLEQKGYGGCSIKLERINKRPFVVLYLSKYNATEFFVNKCIVELGIEKMAPVRTQYTMCVPGVNVTSCFYDLVEKIHKLSSFENPIDTSNLYSEIECLNKLCIKFPEDAERCRRVLNEKDAIGIILYCARINQISLKIVEDKFFIPYEVEL